MGGPVPSHSMLICATLAELHHWQDQARKDMNWAAVKVFQSYIDRRSHTPLVIGGRGARGRANKNWSASKDTRDE